MARTIRDYAEADREQLVALSLRAWAPVFASLERVLRGSGVFEAQYPDWRSAQRAAVEGTCDDEGSRVWVAELDGAVAGFCSAGRHEAARMGEISMLAVDPDRQRRGVGAALTDVATAWLAGQGMRTVMVETGGDPGHAPARATYERAGFTLLPVARYFKVV